MCYMARCPSVRLSHAGVTPKQLAVFYLHLPMTDGELRRLSLSIISHIIMMIVYRMRVSMIVDLTFPVATFVFETLDMLIVSL